jgi:hypothetical protein
MKSTSLFAVLIGSGVGVVAAIGGRGRPEVEPPPLPPVAAKPVAPRLGAPATSPSEKVEHDIAAAPEKPVRESPAETDPPIASPEEFEAAAIACDEKDAGACRRAAAASELGAVVPKDLERAKTFRKVELTVLVRGCEKGSVAECLTLADRYLRGEGVARNERTALALIEHTRELCARRPSDACRDVPEN